MLRFSAHSVLLLAAWLSGVALVAGLALGEEARVDNSIEAIGEDFRVNNTVYAGEKKEPISQSVTIFHDGIVYDCLRTPAETVVFDRMLKKFSLLNMSNATRTELTTRDVNDFIARFESRLRSVIEKKPDPLLRFMADPKFEEKSDESAGKLTLSSPLVSYTLTLSPSQGETIAAQYREFADWYARLNLRLTRGAMPPFARLVVNDAVARRKAIATQVTLTINPPRPDGSQSSALAAAKTRTIRSTHNIVRPLSAADLQQVDRIKKAMIAFRPVDFENYRKGEQK